MTDEEYIELYKEYLGSGRINPDEQWCKDCIQKKGYYETYVLNAAADEYIFFRVDKNKNVSVRRIDKVFYRPDPR